ncbi:MAG TPA: hypothetical protein VJ324_03595, partial [Candidatus Acidoferrum sp.]|nr:hypothetical protein [Candidatus Acidoferrum sp.]
MKLSPMVTRRVASESISISTAIGTRRPYSIQDSTPSKIGWLVWDRLQPVSYSNYTNAEIPVIFSPMISL